jgi:predicted sulfurtransferase/predicted O-methyltransferase YrrM
MILHVQLRHQCQAWSPHIRRALQANRHTVTPSLVQGSTRPPYAPTAFSALDNNLQRIRPFTTTRLYQSSKSIPTTQQLVEQRLAVNRAKQEASKKSANEVAQRNYRIKQLLHGNKTQSSLSASTLDSSSIYEVPPLYAIKVSVCEELRESLRLTGREKRGRVFVEAESAATCKLADLRQSLHSFFRTLRKRTYLLKAGVPKIQTSIDAAVDLANKTISIDDHSMFDWMELVNDESVVEAFSRADSLFELVTSASDTALSLAQSTISLKRPTLWIHVEKDPNAPLEPPPPAYLQNLPNPADSPTWTMLSFYAFPPQGIADPEDFASQLKRLWRPFAVLGRVYVANEGVNAQMSVPTNVQSQFRMCCESIPELGVYMENGINVDPRPLTREEFAVAGGSSAPGTDPIPPFRNLHIRVRAQVVADGLSEALDWQSAGYDMPPLEWHKVLLEHQKKMQEMESTRSTDASHDKTVAPILLDCRNAYETSLGRFEGAEPLETETFRDTWKVLQDRLANVPKDTPVMTYCTGGIRCVKVGAYLTQTMGFTNVSRLAGGIIAYDRALQQEQEKDGKGSERDAASATAIVEEKGEVRSLFKGTNFVFDGRLGRPITDDALGTCITCGAATSLVGNCKNSNCHQRITQCEACRGAYAGTCSEACYGRLIQDQGNSSSSSNDMDATNRNMQPRRLSVETRNPQDSTSVEGAHSVARNDRAATKVFTTLDDYSQGYTTPMLPLYNEIELNTQHLIPSGSHMVSGALQGRWLTQLASMTPNGRILEVGTFSGYATACLWQGAMRRAEEIQGDGNSGSRPGPYVMTLERDGKAFDVAVAHLQAIDQHGFTDAAANHLRSLREERIELDGSVISSIPMVRENYVSVKLPIDGSNSSGNNGDTVAHVRCDLLRVTDALAIVESMAAGTGTTESLLSAPFDMIFLDADKTRLLDYIEACLSKDNRLLRKGGVIVVDNVLWKGLVLDSQDGAGDTSATSLADDSATENESDMKALRKNRRARKMANQMHAFNSAILQDDRVEVMLLPIRDGLSVIRKK